MISAGDKDAMTTIDPRLHYGSGIDRDPYWRKRVQTTIDLMKPRLHPGVRLLEVGCYNGDLARFLSEGIEHHGYDYDPDALAVAESRGVIPHRINLDREELVVDEPFDLAVCTEVLEHLVEPHRVIASIARALKPDGRAVISLPNENTIYHRLMALVGKGVDMYAFDVYKHLHLPTVRQSKAFVSRYFELEEVTYYINPRAEGSRWESLGSLFCVVPDRAWNALAHTAPGLFARGTIFLGRPK